MDSIYKMLQEMKEAGKNGRLIVSQIRGGELWYATIVDYVDGDNEAVFTRDGSRVLLWRSIKPEYAIECLNTMCKIGE